MKKLILIALAASLALSAPIALADAPTALSIGALSPSPHADILEFVRGDLEALGYELDVVEFGVEVLLNPVLSAEEIDANYFQGLAYMDEYNGYAAQSEQLAAAFAVHFAPFGLYAGRADALSDLDEGGAIAIPDDPAGATRALSLLQDAGLIELSKDVESIEHMTAADISANPRALDIRAVKSAALKDFDFVVLSAASALSAGLRPVTDAVFLEPADSPAALQSAEFVAVRATDIDADFTRALRQVLLTRRVHDYILTSDAYRGGIAPAFVVEDGA